LKNSLESIKFIDNDNDWHNTELAPIPTVNTVRPRLIFRYITIDFHDAESISDLLSAILKVPYSQLNVWQRLKVRRALALQIFKFEVIHGSRVAVSYGKKIEMSHVGIGRQSNEFAYVDYRTERSLISSLVDFGLLTILERSDSRLLRGTPNMSNLKFSSCHDCAFSQWNGNCLFCSVVNQDPAPNGAPLPTECQFYCFKDNNDKNSTSENYVPIFSHDICHLNGILDEAVWEKDWEILATTNSPLTPPPTVSSAEPDNKAI